MLQISSGWILVQSGTSDLVSKYVIRVKIADNHCLLLQNSLNIKQRTIAICNYPLAYVVTACAMAIPVHVRQFYIEMTPALLAHMSLW